jgi:hypothetical protein
MAGGSNGCLAALMRRQLTPGLTSSLPGTAGLPPLSLFRQAALSSTLSVQRCVTHGERDKGGGVCTARHAVRLHNAGRGRPSLVGRRGRQRPQDARRLQSPRPRSIAVNFGVSWKEHVWNTKRPALVDSDTVRDKPSDDRDDPRRSVELRHESFFMVASGSVASSGRRLIESGAWAHAVAGNGPLYRPDGKVTWRATCHVASDSDTNTTGRTRRRKPPAIGRRITRRQTNRDGNSLYAPHPGHPARALRGARTVVGHAPGLSEAVEAYRLYLRTYGSYALGLIQMVPVAMDKGTRVSFRLLGRPYPPGTTLPVPACRRSVRTRSCASYF